MYFLSSDPECWISGKYVYIILGEGTLIGDQESLNFKSSVIKERDVPSDLANYVSNADFNRNTTNVRMIYMMLTSSITLYIAHNYLMF